MGISKLAESLITSTIASDEKQEQRRKTCDSCDKNKLGVCTECGCVLAFKSKFEKASCPLGKW